MKTKQIAFLILLLVVAGIVFLLQQQTRQHPTLGDMVSSAKPLHRAEEEVEKKITDATNIDIKRPPLPVGQTPHGIPSLNWETPINFYGKVVDEMNVPVAEADVVIHWGNANGEGQQATMRTDARGLFLLNGAKGRSINVYVTKIGYYTLKNQTRFMYADTDDRHFHRPNADAPIVFALKERGKAEPLLHGQKLFGFKADGTKYFLDLETQKNRLTPPGHIAISFTRGERNPDGKYDWSATLSAPGGGIVESVEEFQFLAPVEGYETSVEVSRQAADPNWTSSLKKRFFFKTGQKEVFGRIEVTLIPKYNELAAADLVFFLNRNGSRNLEYDPAVQPKQTVFE